MPPGEQVLDLYDKIHRTRAKLIGPDGVSRSLPGSLHEFLGRLVSDLQEGQSVAIVQDDTHLTTVEAARTLGMSRQFLVGLLERDKIPHHMVGTHRRIYLRDVLAYKANRDSKRRQVLDDLTRSEVKDGLYDLEPPVDGVE